MLCNTSGHCFFGSFLNFRGYQPAKKRLGVDISRWWQPSTSDAKRWKTIALRGFGRGDVTWRYPYGFWIGIYLYNSFFAALQLSTWKSLKSSSNVEPDPFHVFDFCGCCCIWLVLAAFVFILFWAHCSDLWTLPSYSGWVSWDMFGP